MKILILLVVWRRICLLGRLAAQPAKEARGRYAVSLASRLGF
jgi:hypothetical protein